MLFDLASRDILINPPNSIQGATPLICNQLVFIYGDTWEANMEKCSVSTECFHLTPPTQFHFKPSRFQGGPALPESHIPEADSLSTQLLSALPLLSANTVFALYVRIWKTQQMTNSHHATFT